MKQNKKSTRTTLILLGLALAAIVVLVSVLNQLAYTSPPEDELRVSLNDAKNAFDAGTALFVDVRGSEEYAASHIPGAVLITLSQIEGNEPVVGRDALIYTYCT